MSKKLSVETKEKGVSIGAFLGKGYNAENYTVKELSSIFTRTRDMVRKTVNRFEKTLTHGEDKNFVTILMDTTTGEVIKKSDYLRTLKELKTNSNSEDEMKRNMIEQIRYMFDAQEEFRLGTKKEQKRNKDYINEYNSLFGAEKYKTINPVQMRNDKESAEAEIRKMANDIKYQYGDIDISDDGESNGLDQFVRILQKTIKQQTEHMKEVYSFDFVKNVSAPLFRKLMKG